MLENNLTSFFTTLLDTTQLNESLQLVESLVHNDSCFFFIISSFFGSPLLVKLQIVMSCKSCIVHDVFHNFKLCVGAYDH